MIRYQIVEEALFDPDTGAYTTYGIRADCVDEYSTKQAAFISDISLTRKVVEKLVERCNRLQLDLIHFQDVAEDAAQMLDE